MAKVEPMCLKCCRITLPSVLGCLTLLTCWEGPTCYCMLSTKLHWSVIQLIWPMFIIQLTAKMVPEGREEEGGIGSNTRIGVISPTTVCTGRSHFSKSAATFSTHPSNTISPIFTARGHKCAGKTKSYSRWWCTNGCKSHVHNSTTSLTTLLVSMQQPGNFFIVVQWGLIMVTYTGITIAGAGSADKYV